MSAEIKSKTRIMPTEIAISPASACSVICMNCAKKGWGFPSGLSKINNLR
jgi:hypothetical protein